MKKTIGGLGLWLVLGVSAAEAANQEIRALFTPDRAQPNKNVFVNLDVKKVWMDTKLQVNGEDAGKIKINPWIIGVGIGTKF